MTELLAVTLLTCFSILGLGLMGARAESIQRRIESLLAAISAAIILFLMAYVLAEVLMRYAFNSPLPGHLEGAELLLPMIVFLAVSYTQARNGHVGMSLVVDALPHYAQRAINIVTLTLSVLTCAVLAYFGTKQAYFAWEIEDVTMTPPYWRIWPSAAVVALGYFLLSIRMSLQILQSIIPGKFPDPVADDLEQPSTSQ